MTPTEGPEPQLRVWSPTYSRWHTWAHTVSAFVLFVPCLLVLGTLVAVFNLGLDPLMQEGRLPDTWYTPIIRALQYGVSAFAALRLAHLVFRKSRAGLVSKVFSGVFSILILGALGFVEYRFDLTWHDRIDTLASLFGVLVGSGAARDAS